QRKQSAEELMSTPPKDITPILPQTAVLFYQSFATVFETPYLDLTLKTIEEAYRLGVPVGLDNNIRQASVKKLKTMSDATQKVYGKLDFLKVNEGEAKIILNSNIDEPMEEITLQENELPRVANEIANSYGIKTVAITMGERGSFILTEDEELRFKAVKPENFVNSLGAGDLWCAGYCMKYPRKLMEREAGFLATILGSLATEGTYAYPSHLTKKKIRNRIQDNSELYHIAPNQLLKKLKLS
ncbi:MAG: carbohydrate kinase family protein, partial [Candidatus Wukongarchaeota archaeon]|nr:carbohydrate kinase family protein [Candidatus Wukongarchaeota archaeon]